MFVSILETDNIAALDRQADPNDHDELQNCVVATAQKNSMQQVHTTHFLSGIGTFTPVEKANEGMRYVSLCCLMLWEYVYFFK